MIRPNPSVASAYQAVGQLHGIELDQETIRARFGEAIRRYGVFAFQQARGQVDPYQTDETSERARWQAIVQFVLAPTPQQLPSLFKALWEHFGRAESWQLFEDVVPALTMIAEQGFRLGLASNFDQRLRPIANKLLGKFDLTLFISSEVGWVKPAESFYASITRQLKVSPDEIFLIGDDWENDIAAPRQCGWQAAFLNRSGKQNDLATEPGFRTLEEVVLALSSG